MEFIRGDKPSGYFTTFDKYGNKIEGETRQCAHCQFTWVYQPGSGRTRGLCRKCNGLTCARPECIAEQERINGNKMDCVPFTIRIQKQQEQLDILIDKGAEINKDFISTPSGILIKR